MCDTYIDGIGYLCKECQEDVSRVLGEERMTYVEIVATLKEFIGIDKRDAFEPPYNGMTVKEFFRDYTDG